MSQNNFKIETILFFFISQASSTMKPLGISVNNLYLGSLIHYGKIRIFLLGLLRLLAALARQLAKLALLGN